MVLFVDDLPAWRTLGPGIRAWAEATKHPAPGTLHILAISPVYTSDMEKWTCNHTPKRQKVEPKT